MGEDYRGGARDAVAALLRGRMDQLIDAHLERMAELGQADRRNGCDCRHLLTGLGDGHDQRQHDARRRPRRADAALAANVGGVICAVDPGNAPTDLVATSDEISSSSRGWNEVVFRFAAGHGRQAELTGSG
jgi:hypothetical protein